MQGTDLSVTQHKAVRDKFKGANDIELARQMLKNTSGIQLAEKLSIMHIQAALECLDDVISQVSQG